jgi:hypothetical protein
MTLLTRGILLSVLGLTACGDSGPAPYTLTLLGDRVSYVAAQDGDGAWQQIAFDASGMATFEVTRGYHGLAVVCVRLLIVRYDAGADEPLAPCATVTSSQISGTVMPATATVWGQRGLGDSTNGTYRVRTSQGRRDLVALADDRVLFQRDLQIDADRTIDLDVSTAGVPLTTLTPIVSGNGAESFRAYAEILTVNGTYAETSSGTFAVVPSAQRVPGDRVAIGAQITIGGSVQTVQREQINELAPSLTFEPLPHLAIDRAGMQWDPEWDFAATSTEARRISTRPPPGLRRAARRWRLLSMDLAYPAGTPPLPCPGRKRGPRCPPSSGPASEISPVTIARTTSRPR